MFNKALKIRPVKGSAWLFLFSFCLLFSSFHDSAWPAVPTEEELLKKVEDSWGNLNSYWARFEQINRFSPEEQPENYTGQLWLQRPSRVRLDYKLIKLNDVAGASGSIKEQDITSGNITAASADQAALQPKDPLPSQNLAAGMEADVDEMVYTDDIKLLYRYDRMENTLTKTPMEPDSLPLFLAFLVSEQKFRADRFKKKYVVNSIAEDIWQGVNCYRFMISAKDPEDRAKREFWLDKKNLLPVRTTTILGNGQVDVFLKEFQSNKPIPAEILQGHVPSDVKVIDLTMPE